jgi:hypothetical protein
MVAIGVMAVFSLSLIDSFMLPLPLFFFFFHAHVSSFDRSFLRPYETFVVGVGAFAVPFFVVAVSFCV